MRAFTKEAGPFVIKFQSSDISNFNSSAFGCGLAAVLRLPESSFLTGALSVLPLEIPVESDAHRGTHSQALLLPERVAQRLGRNEELHHCMAWGSSPCQGRAPSPLGRGGALTHFDGRGEDGTNTVRYTHEAPGVLPKRVEKWPPARSRPTAPGWPDTAARPLAVHHLTHQPALSTRLRSVCLMGAPSTRAQQEAGRAWKRIPASSSSTPLRSVTNAAFSNMVSGIGFYRNAYVSILKMRRSHWVYRPTTS